VIADLKPAPTDERAQVTQGCTNPSGNCLHLYPHKSAYPAQKLSAGPPLSELTLSEREDRVGRGTNGCDRPCGTASRCHATRTGSQTPWSSGQAVAGASDTGKEWLSPKAQMMRDRFDN
jgi:hypothetical protein